MIDTKALRSRILDLAIQGKLTQQLESDGTAEELYQQIQAEKQKLIKEGKIRKEKPLPEITADEIPFEIPNNWKWLQCADLCANIPNAFADGPFGSNLKTDHYTQEKQVRIIQLGNIGEDGWRDKNEKYTTFEHLKTIERSEVKAGNIVIAKMMPAGRAIIVPDISVKYVLSSDCIKFVPHERLNTQFICYAINSSFFRSSVIQNVNGIGRERTSLSKLKKCILPLPPLAEQKRIVQRVEEIFRLLDTIDEAQEKYSADTEILKAKLFSLAIQGKLTEQLESDGTAADLYQMIQEQKEILAKKGELYREKAIKKVTPEDMPYSIPDSWLWVRLGELAKVVTKGSSPKWQGVNYTDADNGILFVTSENVGNGIMLLEKRKYVQKQFNEMHPSSVLCKGDILTNIVGASIGRTAIFDEDTDTANTNQAVCIVRLINQNMSDYILRYLCSKDAIQLMLGKVIDTARANLSLTSVSNLMVPLPPLDEQKRIAETLEKVLGALG